jgi:DNA-binding response OmpR family regulator
VILCDLVMSGTTGDQFCSWLKAHETWRFVPVIAITRIDHPAALAGMLEAGADDVIVKPVSSGELRARVAAALRTRRRYVDLMRSAGG